MNTIAGKTSLNWKTLGERIPAPLFFVGSSIFHYLGPSFAVLLFARVPVAGVAWLRIVSAALIFATWRRPWRLLWVADRRIRWTIVALGIVLAAMNYSFYLAIDRLPLGTVAAIEFLGPIALAVAGSRSARNIVAIVLAVGGVYLLTDVRIHGASTALGWAFANAAMFTAYIVLAHRIAQADTTTSPIDRLAASMIVAGVIITPLAFGDAASALIDPVALAAGIGVGITSSVIPYVVDQLAMARLPRATYALFISLLPATAVLVGVIVLHQVPSIVELAGVGMVALGVALHRQTK
jgi:inner membrane transporter RhtA